MVFSLFQNVPMCEEDPHVKTELVKKNVKENGSGGEDSDEDADGAAVGEYIGTSHAFNWSQFSIHNGSYTRATSWYDCFVQDKNTPPPKV